MANEEHGKILKLGTVVWNQWRDKIPDVVPDLSDASLIGAKLSGANFMGAKLGGANLREADLTGANLRQADLGEAILFKADLKGADLRGADLKEADLRGAYLTEADLRGAYFAEANLTRAQFKGADLTEVRFALSNIADTDLSKALNLSLARHDGPSTIGIDALYKSAGQIPETFLRDAGVPDDFITYIPSLFGTPIQFYSCFISYSHKDEGFAQRLHSALREKHLRVWYAPEDIKAGRKLHDQIDEAIRLHDKLLLVLSDNSILSEWVMTEIRKARRRELKEKRQVLFPIRLTDMTTLKEWSCFDADSRKDLAVEVREYFVPDFSNWKNHDSFQRAFDRLIKDLKNSETKP